MARWFSIKVMTQTICPKNSPQKWWGCYSGNYDLWVPESYSHPAKMAPGLCFKIIEHLKELGYLEPDSIILDFMAGIGTTGLCAGVLGCRSIMVELEPKFIDLMIQNKVALERKWSRPVEMEIIQGDARWLSELLQERGLVGITSPPYGDTDKPTGGLNYKPPRSGRLDQSGRDPNAPNYVGMREGYGSTSGQIGQLSDKPLKAIVSPPYEDSNVSRSDTWQNGNRFGGPYSQVRAKPYGRTDGQIGQEKDQTYLEVMAQVYAEALKVCDILVVVVKDPTRNGKLRKLGSDTIRILEAVRWEIFDYHQSILFEEQEHGHLFEGKVKRPKGRLGFFKRLAYQRGSQVANFEHIIFARRVR